MSNVEIVWAGLWRVAERFAERFLTWLHHHVGLEIGSERGGFAALHASVDLRAAQIRAERMKAPTLSAAFGCVNCGLIQVAAEDHRCAMCGSSSLFNVTKVLERDTRRQYAPAPLVFATGRKKAKR